MKRGIQYRVERSGLNSSVNYSKARQTSREHNPKKVGGEGQTCGPSDTGSAASGCAVAIVTVVVVLVITGGDALIRPGAAPLTSCSGLVFGLVYGVILGWFTVGITLASQLRAHHLVVGQRGLAVSVYRPPWPRVRVLAGGSLFPVPRHRGRGSNGPHLVALGGLPSGRPRMVVVRSSSLGGHRRLISHRSLVARRACQRRRFANPNSTGWATRSATRCFRPEGGCQRATDLSPCSSEL